MAEQCEGTQASKILDLQDELKNRITNLGNVIKPIRLIQPTGSDKKAQESSCQVIQNLHQMISIVDEIVKTIRI